MRESTNRKNAEKFLRFFIGGLEVFFSISPSPKYGLNFFHHPQVCFFFRTMGPTIATTIQHPFLGFWGPKVLPLLWKVFFRQTPDSFLRECAPRGVLRRDVFWPLGVMFQKHTVGRKSHFEGTPWHPMAPRGVLFGEFFLCQKGLNQNANSNEIFLKTLGRSLILVWWGHPPGFFLRTLWAGNECVSSGL